MKKLTILFTLFLVFSCSDYVEAEKKSSDGKFSVIAKVNRTDKNAEFYAEPIFEIYDSNKTLIQKIESGAGDYSKWEVGWSKNDNILIMYSSDIGNRAWKINDNRIEKTELTPELNNQADNLVAE